MPRVGRRGFVALGGGLTLSACARWRSTPHILPVTGPRLAPEGAITRVAFGSCCDQELPAPIWDAIVDRRPDLFLMIGDNVYADAEEVRVLARAYDGLRDSAGYSKLRAATPVLATWDDHDYGRDDAGSEYPLKDESKSLLLDFFDEPRRSRRRSRPGIYTAHVVGPPGRRVQVVLLDARYFRSEPGASGDAEGAPPSSTLLGEAQWRWLEAQLAVPADLRLVVSSIQVLADEHRFERWGTFPHERARIVELLGRTPRTLVLSGDRHRGELSRWSGPRPLYDLTSSSLNRPFPGHDDNGLRVGDEVGVANFGAVEIDWEAGEVLLALVDPAGRTPVARRVALVDL